MRRDIKPEHDATFSAALQRSYDRERGKGAPEPPPEAPTTVRVNGHVYRGARVTVHVGGEAYPLDVREINYRSTREQPPRQHGADDDQPMLTMPDLIPGGDAWRAHEALRDECDRLVTELVLGQDHVRDNIYPQTVRHPKADGKRRGRP